MSEEWLGLIVGLMLSAVITLVFAMEFGIFPNLAEYLIGVVVNIGVVAIVVAVFAAAAISVFESTW